MILISMIKCTQHKKPGRKHIITGVPGNSPLKLTKLPAWFSTAARPYAAGRALAGAISHR